MFRRIVALACALILTACESTYYDAWEKVGVHKRDILIDRLEEVQAAQEEGQEQFKDALEQFKAVVTFDGGKLEDVYNRLNDEYEDSVSAAEEISDRINSVESVAEALFSEWEAELQEYDNANLRRDSARQLKQTQRKYRRLHTAMRNAEKTIDPVLSNLKDNVLYLKHNLNARAIASLKNELGNVNRDITIMIDAMQRAINESNSFIDEMKQG
jgi:hydroxymethylpyrimidine pyrophosphatase-like HAD family hydrolase